MTISVERIVHNDYPVEEYLPTSSVGLGPENMCCVFATHVQVLLVRSREGGNRFSELLHPNLPVILLMVQ